MNTSAPRRRPAMLEWARGYDRGTLGADLLAAVIVTLMLIPQSLAYATLAGLPAQAGLYASIAPLLLYALFGSSRVLAVGPVAVVSLMTATAIHAHAAPGSAHYAAVALTLAFLSGAMLLVMGLLRLGALANFLSHPVISGFITASALLIAAGQLKVMLGVQFAADNFFELVAGMLLRVEQTHGLTAGIGAVTALALWWVRRGLKPLLTRLGVSNIWADALAKAGPVFGVGATAALTWALAWDQAGVKIVGHVPQGLPPLTLPLWDASLWKALAVPALLISVVGFVESVSVGQTLAARRRQRIDPNRELVALGAGNLGAALTGGFPVTGGFARSVVNFDAGARTPAAGVFTAGGIALAALLLTPALHYVPQATLAATIVVAVLSLVDLQVLRRTWDYSRADFAAVATTVGATLALGIETGLIAGMAVSIALFLLRTSRPHIAEVGLVPGTEHFRNVQRHDVIVDPEVVSLRVDESLYFANARALEDRIGDVLAQHPRMKHLVLQCSAINAIDASALDSLHAIDHRLRDADVTLHLSEVKGPVMDRLARTPFIHDLKGSIFLTHYQAVQHLTPHHLAAGVASETSGGTGPSTVTSAADSAVVAATASAPSKAPAHDHRVAR